MEAKNSGQLTVAGTRGFLPVWLAWVTVGETLGFLVPILTHLTASLFVPDFIFPLLVGAVEATTAMLSGDVMGDSRVWIRLMVIFDTIFIVICLWAFDFVIEE